VAIQGLPSPDERYDRENESQFRRQVERSFLEVTAYVERLIVDPDFIDPLEVDEIFEKTADAGVTVDGVLLKDGLIADSAIAETGVTQHEAALTILESQITDGALLARVGSNEAITGLYTFSNAGGIKTDLIAERTAAAGVTIDGVLLKDSGITIGADVIFTTGVTWRANTADAADNSFFQMAGGGSASPSRGAAILLSGNEHAQAGKLILYAGNTGTGFIYFNTGNANRALFDQLGMFLPVLNNTYDIGSSGNAWRSGYFDTDIKTDLISEHVAGAGVTVDGVLLKDSKVQVANGTTTSPTVYGVDPTTGMRFSATEVGWVRGGVRAAEFGNTGFVIREAGAVMLHQNGTAANPAYSFLSQTNSGFYRITTDRFGFSVATSLRMEWHTAGVDVKGDFDVDGHYEVDGTQVVSNQGAAVSDASGGTTIDVEARTAINALLARCRTHGLIAT